MNLCYKKSQVYLNKDSHPQETDLLHFQVTLTNVIKAWPQ